MGEPLSRAWYAETVCQMIARGEPRHNWWRGPLLSEFAHGWGHYLARWIWLKDKNLERDP